MTITKTIVLGTLSGACAWIELRGFVDAINRREPSFQDRIVCKIVDGTLTATVERPLTTAEEAVEWKRRYESMGDEIRTAMPGVDPGGLTTEQWLAFARRLFAIIGPPPAPQTGSDAPGTGAPVAGPAEPNAPTPPAPAPTDEQRRNLFRTIAQVRGGWDLSTVDGARAALTYARQNGMPDLAGADVERWEGLPTGSLFLVV